MRQLLPTAIDDIEIEPAYQTPAGEPWLRLSMVLSVDGAATDDDGWTTNLAGAPDARMLRALRAVADAVIVGAGTVRTGRLGPIRTPRYQLAGEQTARQVIVSGSLDLDWSLPLFTASVSPPIVVTSAARAASTELPTVVRENLLIAGDDSIELADTLDQLRARGYSRLLCEGGPALAASMLGGGVVDELCLTIAPTIMSADRLRGLVIAGSRIPLRLTHVGEDDGVLFLRYCPLPS